MPRVSAGINLNPYQGLKQMHLGRHSLIFRRNQPKSLSGIETPVVLGVTELLRRAGINLNPYQGLKLGLKPLHRQCLPPEST